MKKYTRKQINLKPDLHGKQFVTVEDAVNALVELGEAAVEAGADESKMMGVLNGEKTT